MPQEPIIVCVSWRDIQILEDVLLSDVSPKEAFLASDAPLPVGSMVVVSPLENREIRIPARVALTQERLGRDGEDAGQAGMKLVFEAAGELLEPFLTGEVEGFSEADVPESASQASVEYAEISTSQEENETREAREEGLAGEGTAEGAAAESTAGAAAESAEGDPAVVIRQPVVLEPEPALGGDEASFSDFEDEDEDEVEDEDEDDVEPPPDEDEEPVELQPRRAKTISGAMDSAISPQASGEIDLSRAEGSHYMRDAESPDKVIVDVDDQAMMAGVTTDEAPGYDDGGDTKVAKKKKKRRGRGKRKKR